MEITVKLTIPQSAMFQAGMPRRILQEEVAKGTQQIEERILAAARLNAAVDRGELRRHLAIRPPRKPATGPILVHSMVASGKQTPYAEGIERGTKPHWIAGQDFEELQGWSKRKLGDARAAWAVRAHIAKFGTKAQPFLEPASREVEAQVNTIMNASVAVAVHRIQQ